MSEIFILRSPLLKWWNLYESSYNFSSFLPTVKLTLAYFCTYFDRIIPCLWPVFYALCVWCVCNVYSKTFSTLYISWCSTWVDCIIYWWFEQTYRWGSHVSFPSAQISKHSLKIDAAHALLGTKMRLMCKYYCPTKCVNLADFHVP